MSNKKLTDQQVMNALGKFLKKETAYLRKRKKEIFG